MASREQILDALLALLAATGEFKLVSRRDRAPETIGPALSPAVFLLENPVRAEKYERPSPSSPPIRTLYVDAVFYNDAGADPNVIPLTIVNDALDALDAALKPDSPMTGRLTLGGLVYSVMREGDARKSDGAKTGRAVAIAPIAIILP